MMNLDNSCSLSKGGLGLVNITLKLESLRCAHLRKLVTGTVAKWKYYWAIYWTGLTWRRYDSSFASLLIPHAEQPSEFYNKTLDTFRKLTTSSAVVEPQDLKARLVYRKLQATEFATSVVIDKFPHVHFYKAFTNLNSCLIHPRAREPEWRVLHRVVPVNEYLFRLHINRNALSFL